MLGSDDTLYLANLKTWQQFDHNLKNIILTFKLLLSWQEEKELVEQAFRESALQKSVRESYYLVNVEWWKAWLSYAGVEDEWTAVYREFASNSDTGFPQSSSPLSSNKKEDLKKSINLQPGCRQPGEITNSILEVGGIRESLLCVNRKVAFKLRCIYLFIIYMYRGMWQARSGKM